MKIVFLNTWHAERKKELAEFLVEHIETTEMFCLQEVGPEVRDFFEELLTEYTPFYTEKENDRGEPGDRIFANGTYIKEGAVEIISCEPVLKNTEGTGLGIYSHIKHGGTEYHVCSVHGQSRPGDKLDTEERLKQSRILKEFFNSLSGAKIIGGDFNLMPETESVKILEEAGFRNLIKDFNIKTTRNRLGWEKHPETPQYFADYVFTDSNVQVEDFKVIENEVSDHLPMVLKIK